MAHISYIKTLLIGASCAFMAACVPAGDDVSSTSSDVIVHESQLVEASSQRVTFTLKGLSQLPSDLRLGELAFESIELVLEPQDETQDTVVLPIDELQFNLLDGQESASVELPGVNLAPGVYIAQMRVRSGDNTEDRGLRFSGWIDPSAPVPFDSRIAGGGEMDGPNPHPFEGGDDGDDDGPAPPGTDPLEDSGKMDGPNPHPFEGGDDGDDDGPAPPGTDPVESSESDAQAWTALTFQGDDSMLLEIGEITVVGDLATLNLCINLPEVEVAPESISTQPPASAALANAVAAPQVSTGAELLSEPADVVGAHDAQVQDHSVHHLGMDAAEFIQAGLIYY